MGKLSDKAVQAADVGKHADGEGLTLVVKDNGTRVWWFRYRFGGKEKTLSIGKYPLINLKDARERAFEARKLLANGADPMAVKQEAEEAIKTASAPVETFEKVMNELLEAKANRASEDHIENYRRSLEMHVLPTFGKRDIRNINAIEIIELGKKTESKGRYQAHRIIQRIREVMDFAVATGRREQNPVTKMTHTTLAPHTRTNNPSMSFIELPEFLRDLAKYRGYPITILMMRFVMLTACRTGEARDLIWDWVDLDNRLITIPPSGHKTGRKQQNQGKQAPSHLIPLADQVVELLIEAQELTGNRGDKRVFPAYRNYDGKASENALSSALGSIGDGKWEGRQSGHGFRRLARTAWGDHGGWSFEAMEKQLAHSVGNATVTAYNKAERLDERARMLQWWADQVSESGSAKVLEFRKKA